MSHRIQNNVGYKKIYPMSLREDDTFCHYCGRKASIDLGLTWDHVPALNVKIPREYKEIRKTLIRACNECNSLASDMPHLDYLERHLWLKNVYLRRYKKLIVSEGDFVDPEETSDGSYLAGVVHNSRVKYKEILHAIGFGINDISQIESPILKIKTKKSKRKIAHVLFEYLYGVPTEDDELELPNSSKYSSEADGESSDVIYSLNEFISFLVGEFEAGNKIENHESYENWCINHPDRTLALELPKFPHKHLGISWEKIVELVNKEIERDMMRHSENEEY